MDRIIANLVQVDKYLDQLSVKGTDAFHLVNARMSLKSAYDELIKLNAEAKEVDEDAG